MQNKSCMFAGPDLVRKDDGRTNWGKYEETPRGEEERNSFIIILPFTFTWLIPWSGKISIGLYNC